jgi:N-methylhydantoinase B
MTVGSEGIEVDFTGSSPISSYGINVPLTYTQAYASFGVRCVVGGKVPNNAGSLAPIRVWAPEGSILNAPHPCAVAIRHVIGQMLPDVVLGCLYQACGGQVPAEGTSCLWIPNLMGGHGVARDAGGNGGQEGGGEDFVISMFHAGGTGARPGKDGLSATAFPSGVRNTPVEINETIAPIVIWKKEYRRDSGGPGQHRGGLGQVMEIEHAEGRPFVISAIFDRVKNPPRGRAGGGNGVCGRVRLASGRELRGKGRQAVPAGERLIIEMPGGAGYGVPRARDPEKIAADLRNGLVSPEAAARDYGVALEPAPG